MQITPMKKRRYIRLLVTDDAMYEPYSLVIVDTSLRPSEGKAVAIERNGNIMIRYHHKEGNRVILAPQNSEYRKTTLKKTDTILGCAVRTYSRL